jgi:excisionase family DNA binding protein
MTQSTPTDDDEPLTLQAAADILGVHYMTAYRYVRTGRLDAFRDGSHWYVQPAAIANLRAAGAPGRNKLGSSTPRRDYVGELTAHLVVGDEAEAWRVVQDALASAVTPEVLYLEIIGPALRSIGDSWEAGTVSIAEEHRASALAYRLLGRLGPAFTRRGPARGLVVLGSPSGDRHGLASALVADPLRGRGFTVADLGADTPAQSFAEVVAIDARARAVGIVVSVPIDDEVVAGTIAAVRSARSLPVLVGGRTITSAAHATALGADAFSESAPDAIAWFDSIESSPPGPHRPKPPTP